MTAASRTAADPVPTRAPVDQSSAPTDSPVVELRSVSRTFPGPIEVLTDVDLVIETGDYLSIVGRSGSGKSTLLHLIGLLDRPTTGTYLLDGIDVTAVPERRRAALRAQRIGFVFQAFHLLPHRSVLENVMVAMMYQGVPRGKRAARAHDVLEQVGLGHRVRAMPTTLSGGEKQRVAVARALAGNPSLVLADEPTGNLDSASSEAVLEMFADLHRRGITLAVITHDADVSARAQRRVAIVDGRLEDS